MNCGYSTERTANIVARTESKLKGTYYSVFEYKGKWYLTDAYSQ